MDIKYLCKVSFKKRSKNVFSYLLALFLNSSLMMATLIQVLLELCSKKYLFVLNWNRSAGHLFTLSEGTPARESLGIGLTAVEEIRERPINTGMKA